MSMAKRKRKGRPATQNVQRYACGKVRKEYAQKRGETEVAAMATVVAYRSRMGVSGHERRSEAGYELGRMYLSGVVSHRRHEAGKEFAKLRAEYLAAIDAPPEHPRGMDLGSARGLSLGGEPSPERLRKVANQYMQSITALSDAGGLAKREVEDVCLFDRRAENVDNLRRGLDALGDFFGLPHEPVDEQRKSP